MNNDQQSTDKRFEVRLLELQASAPEAKNLLLQMVNERLGYHAQENFSLVVRSGNHGIDHLNAMQLLQDAKKQVNGVIYRALENGCRISITGNLVINLLDEDGCRKVV